MSSYESITGYGERVHLQTGRPDIVILNAGVYRMSMVLNPLTGHEEDIQNNYLSTALLALLFVNIFNRTNNPNFSPGRTVMVSSDTAAWSQFVEKDADPLLPAFDNRTAKWNPHERYGTSNLP